MEPTQPHQGMLGAHAQYVKGLVNEKIGNVVNSEDWKASGRSDQEEGMGSMKVSYTPADKGDSVMRKVS